MRSLRALTPHWSATRNRLKGNKMGEAKRRGSGSERIKAAEEREADQMAELAETTNIQVDEDQYLYCLKVHQAAAGRPMLGAPAFTDRPMNRGLLAVIKAVTDQGMGHRERRAMVFRVMQFFAGIIVAKDRFARWVHPSSKEGALEINEALMRAGATARIIVSSDYIGFDLDDVERCANEVANRADQDTRAG
jgi:hypothetical protein